MTNRGKTLMDKHPEIARLAHKSYPMRVYEDADSGNWVAEVIDLPGCLGVGDTPEEAVKVAKSFIRDWIEEALAQGWNVPAPTKRPEASGKFVVRLPRSLHARLQGLAEIEDTSLNQLVVSLLSDGTKSRELRADFEKFLAAARPSTGWCVAWYAFAAVTPATPIQRQGVYSARLQYPGRPALVAEAPGFYAWASGSSQAPEKAARRRTAVGNA